jgi:hypothetical protein
MEPRPFMIASKKPTEPSLRSSLGISYSFYEKLIRLSASYLHEWSFTKSSGWMLRVHDRKKALFYLVPLQDGFKVSLTIRESERSSLLQVKELEAMHPKISSAKKYPEGYALQSEITSEKGFEPYYLLMKKIIAERN